MASTDDRRTLLQKLRRVEALHAGATTEGEREAAARARERLKARLARLPEASAEPQGDGFYELPWAAEGAHLPSEEQLLRVLSEWRQGRRSASSVREWAARVVDEQVLPHLGPEDPQAPLVEVLLQLAAMHHQPLRPQDLKHLRAFFRDHPKDWRAAWAAWFTFLEQRALARRRPNKSVGSPKP